MVVFVFFAYRDNVKASRYIYVTKNMEILPITINRINNRGGIKINDSLVINARCKLIFCPEGFNGWKTNGPVIDFNSKTHIYRLEDLEIPYEISKKPDSDTLFVKLGDEKLLFLLIE